MLIVQCKTTALGINEAVEEALEFSKDHNVVVELDFYNSTIQLTPYDCPKDLISKYINGYFENNN